MIRGDRQQLPGRDSGASRQEQEHLQHKPRRDKLEQISKGASVTGRHAVKLAWRSEGVNLGFDQVEGTDVRFALAEIAGH